MPGDPREQMVALLVRLEEAAVENAAAFVVVTTDTYTGDVVNASGPFVQAEQALAASGVMDAAWRDVAEDAIEADGLRYVVVPLWEPRQ